MERNIFTLLKFLFTFIIVKLKSTFFQNEKYIIFSIQ